VTQFKIFKTRRCITVLKKAIGALSEYINNLNFRALMVAYYRSDRPEGHWFDSLLVFPQSSVSYSLVLINDSIIQPMSFSIFSVEGECGALVMCCRVQSMVVDLLDKNKLKLSIGKTQKDVKIFALTGN